METLRRLKPSFLDIKTESIISAAICFRIPKMPRTLPRMCSKAYRRLKDFSLNSSIHTWLYRIAINTCLDYKKKSRREVSRTEPLAEDLPSDKPLPEQLYESREITAAVQLALQKLPPKLRAAIVLREIEGLSYKEIADVLHTSMGTVKSRISRAREELRHLLQKKDIG